MGFYLRRALRFGPLRVNLSRPRAPDAWPPSATSDTRRSQALLGLRRPRQDRWPGPVPAEVVRSGETVGIGDL
jgi:hypothetical protein